MTNSKSKKVVAADGEVALHGSRDFLWNELLYPGLGFWTKVKNSFLYPTWLWGLVINDEDAQAVLAGRLSAKTGLAAFVQKILRRTLWFWPRLIEARIWVDEKSDPAPFRELTADSRLLVTETIERVTDTGDAILDIGCNCGRHLAALADLGCTNLYGVDVNGAALDIMPQWFPQLSGTCAVEKDLMQRYLSNSADLKFDIVITRGATVELIHPSYPLVRELTRVTKSYVILLIQESNQGYSRFWTHEFARHGFQLTHLVRPVSQMLDAGSDKEFGQTASLLVYRRAPTAA